MGVDFGVDTGSGRGVSGLVWLMSSDWALIDRMMTLARTGERVQLFGTNILGYEDNSWRCVTWDNVSECIKLTVERLALGPDLARARYPAHET